MDVAWSLDPDLVPRFDPADAVAFTPGGGKIGSLLSGAIDSRLIEWASAKPTFGRVIEIVLNDTEVQMVGVAPATTLRIMVIPASLLPEQLWDRLIQRNPITLTAELDDNKVVAIKLLADSNSTADAGVLFEPGRAVTAWNPRPTLVLMGLGPMVESLSASAELVGWSVVRSPGPESVVGLVETLSRIDGVVVVGHDIEGSSRVLQAALRSAAGYIGSIGPRQVHAAQREWLAYRGITDTARISAPAGIDIGARTSAEVAVSVTAEIIARWNQTRQDVR